MPATPELHVIVLAAGFSSRLGRPKALVRVREVSLLRRTVALVARLAPARIVLVLPRHTARYRSEVRGFRVTFAPNPDRALGLSSSVRRGLARARYSSAVLLLPVDLAALQARELKRLIARWRGARRRVAASRTGGVPRGGVPLILPRWLYARARDVQGDMGLRELVNGLPPQHRVLLTLASARFDVDTRQDLRAARRRTRLTD
jgi:molybdenum cofactor cytidylyltransferase